MTEPDQAEARKRPERKIKSRCLSCGHDMLFLSASATRKRVPLKRLKGRNTDEKTINGFIARVSDLESQLAQARAKNDEWKGLFNSYARNGATRMVMEQRQEIERVTKFYEHDHKLAIEQAKIVLEANTECNQLRAELAALKAK